MSQKNSMLSQNIKNWALTALSLVLILSVTNVTWNIRLRLQETSITLVNINKTSGSLAEYAALQTEMLSSPMNQKAIEHGIELGKVATETVVKINRSTVPKLNAALDGITGVESELRITAANLGVFVSNTDHEVNQKLLPSITTLITSMNVLSVKFGTTIDELNDAIKMAANQTNKSLDEVYKLISDPKVMSILTSVDKTMQNVATTSASIDAAAKSAPGIAQSLEKIAATSSRYQKIVLISGIISTLIKAFLP